MNDKKTVVTISREFGSGGRHIGELLAEELGIGFYGRVLIEIAAEKSGLAPEFIKETEKSAAGGYLCDVSAGFGYSSTAYCAPSVQDQVFLTQSRVIREIAERESCVIVGRCADYILRELPDVLHVFVYGDIEKRTERAISAYNVPSEKALEEVKKRDTARAKQYKYYTNHIWGDMHNYHICINSGLIGIENSVKLLRIAIESRQ